MVRPMRKTRAPTQSQRAIGHIAALQSIATMFVMHAMVGRSTLQFKMPRLDAYAPLPLSENCSCNFIDSSQRKQTVTIAKGLLKDRLTLLLSPLQNPIGTTAQLS